MQKKKLSDSLMFRFTSMFVVLTLIVLIVAGFATYYSQMNIYKNQCRDRVMDVGVYLAELMKAEGEDIITYRDYYMSHYKEMKIPVDFEDYDDAWYEYERIMADEYPGKVLGYDIDLDELSEEAQRAYFTYTHEYWLLTFEKAREVFDLPYTYFLVMVDSEETARDMGYEEVEFDDSQGDPHKDNVVYMIDGERTAREDDPEYLYLGDTYYNKRSENEIMWKTWDTGKKQDGYKEWDNQWGHTYGYYTPLVIEGQKVGLVVSEIDYESVNKQIIINTAKQLSVVFFVIIIGILLILYGIKRGFVYKTELLQKDIEEYTDKKDSTMAEVIRNQFKGNDEISILGQKFASLIDEVRDYVAKLRTTNEKLVETSTELEEARTHAEEMAELANKDALTGVRSKTAYAKALKSLQESMEDGETNFGLAMIDLNFLKKINDTYGHEKGDAAIKKLARLVCRIFEHSPVYRIGGDEFVVVLKNADYRNRNILVGKFESSIDNYYNDDSLAPWERVSAAIGISICDSGSDKTVDDVFRRADDAMYIRKKEMKAEREK
ncbi:MAG: diguanylate cyclase [Lachnospiraceae bacterium]|nr:diguanylate cyclase [Lachnospiraceae bacterium]